MSEIHDFHGAARRNKTSRRNTIECSICSSGMLFLIGHEGHDHAAIPQAFYELVPGVWRMGAKSLVAYKQGKASLDKRDHDLGDQPQEVGTLPIIVICPGCNRRLKVDAEALNVHPKLLKMGRGTGFVPRGGR